MKKCIYVGTLLFTIYGCSYAGDTGFPRSDTSLSLVAAHGHAVSLQTVSAHFHDMLPHSSSSISNGTPLLSPAKPTLNGGSKRSSASSSEGDRMLTLDTDTENSFGEGGSFATLTSQPPSPHHSPRNSIYREIISYYSKVLPSIKNLLARVPGLDKYQHQDAAEQLTRNVIAQALLLSGSGEKNIKRFLENEQDDVELAQNIEIQNTKSCQCCVIL